MSNSVVTDTITILDTAEMVMEFERDLGYTLIPEDRLEIFNQLFLILANHSPLDLDDRNILAYDSLVFANHLNVDRVAVDRLAYHLMVRIWNDVQARGFYINGELAYFPYSMAGWDLCVRYYKN